MARYRKTLIKRKVESQTHLADEKNSRPKSSLAQSIAAITQAGILVIAVYGLFLSNAGDRLFELLQGDIRSAEEELRLVNREKFEAQSVLTQQREELSLARRATLENQFELLQQKAELDRAKALERSVRLELGRNNEKTIALGQALSVTRPALMQQRCTAISRQLSPFVGLEMRYRLYPQYRWASFRRIAKNQDLANWNNLQAAFERWSQQSYDEDQLIKRTFQNIDQQIIGHISDQQYWSQFKGERENYVLRNFKIDEPKNFKPRIYGTENARNIEDFVEGYLQLDKTAENIRALLNREPLEENDSAYALFKENLRRRIEPYLKGYSAFVTEKESKNALGDEEILRVVVKQFSYNKNASRARESLIGICFDQGDVTRFMLELE